MDTLGWDCPAPSGDFHDSNFVYASFFNYGPNQSHNPDTNGSDYDLVALNCCIMRDAYWRGDRMLWERVLACLDQTLPGSDS